MRGSAARRLLPALVVLALVGIVAVASRGTTTTGSGESRPPSEGLLDTLFSLGAVGVVIGGVFLVYGLLQRKAIQREIQKQGRLKLMLPTFALLMFLLVVGAYFKFRDWEPREPVDEIGERAFPNGIPLVPEDGTEPTAYEPAFAWVPVALVVGLMLLAVVAYLVAERRRARPARRELDLSERIAAVLDDTLDDLRAEADPRRAVIAAYARLERVLGAYGLDRRPAQTPEEYLATTLESLAVDERAVRRLTSLFAEAKFSEHTVDAAMKDEAIAALVSVRDDLRRGGDTAPDTTLLATPGHPA